MSIVAAVRAFAVLSALLLVSACGMAKFEDVSDDPKYAAFIGQKLIARSDLLIHGVTLDEGQNRAIDYYRVTGQPGIGGPEVLSRGVVPAGTGMPVIRVERCVNCPDHRIELVLETPSQISPRAESRVHYPFQGPLLLPKDLGLGH